MEEAGWQADGSGGRGSRGVLDTAMRNGAAVLYLVRSRGIGGYVGAVRGACRICMERSSRAGLRSCRGLPWLESFNRPSSGPVSACYKTSGH